MSNLNYISRFRSSVLLAGLLNTILFGLLLPNCLQADDSNIDFNRDIRPILSDNCFSCHGPDSEGRQAGLRLDVESDAQDYAFVPGAIDESEGWSRIISTGKDIMPPKNSHKELTDKQKELIKRWIESGAKYEKHWAFLKVSKPEVPSADDNRFANYAIDAFAYQQMLSQGLQPTDSASKHTLIRRVTLDLTGLPPTAQEVRNFLADDAPDAYEKVVDRLLSSKHFGERMAVDWLDIARYGDTSVFHADGPRDMWLWRDWVVDAFNDNMPFDQFSIKQLAGDLLPNATVKDRIASGFNRNNASTDEGGAIAEEFRVEYAVDRVKTTSMVWMGLSMECAQCHDHKYDPISQEEYYKFFAYFNQAADPGMQTRTGNQQPIVEVLDDKKIAKIPEFESKIEAVEQKIEKLKLDRKSEFDSWYESVKTKKLTYGPPSDVLAHFPLDGQVRSVKNTNGSQDATLVESTHFVEGKIGKSLRTNAQTFVQSAETAAEITHTDAFSFGCWVRVDGFQAGSPLARMDDDDLLRGFDLHFGGGQVLVHLIHKWPQNALKVFAKRNINDNKWHHIFATYNGNTKPDGVNIYIDGQRVETSIARNSLTKTIQSKAPLTIGRRRKSSQFKGLVDDVRIYKRCLTEDEVLRLALRDPLPNLVTVDREKLTSEQAAQLDTAFLQREVPEYQPLTLAIDQAKKQIEKLKKPVTTVMVMKDVAKPRMTYVLKRGQYDSPDKSRPVEPGIPEFFDPIPQKYPKNRLGMAKWLVSSEHPLTARVTVNRLWKLFFGVGIVKTVEDFGAQGQSPTHPQLLDWLASDFVNSGWDVKRLIKQIVMSQTYRQSSRTNANQLERDPQNRYWSRGPRFRLPAEFLRDQALAVSGLLNRQFGGPGVKPYQPAGLWNEVSLNKGLRFKRDKGEKLYRRSLYTYWKRSAPPPSMVIFDAPTREKCTVRRGVTNTPLQALVLMNDPQFVESHRVFAERIINEAAEGFDSKLKYAFELAVSRAPTDSETAILKSIFESEKSQFADNPEDAKKLLSVGEKQRDQSIPLDEHAAWTVICGMILNLDEFLTRG